MFEHFQIAPARGPILCALWPTARPSSTVQEFLDHVRQGGRLIRFCQKSIGFQAGARESGFIHGAADQQDFLFRIQSAASANEGQPVHFVHGKIRNDQIRARFRIGVALQSHFGIGEGSNVRLDVAQYVFRQFEKNGFIINDENARAHRPGFGVYFCGSHRSFRQSESTSEYTLGKQIGVRFDYCVIGDY